MSTFRRLLLAFFCILPAIQQEGIAKPKAAANKTKTSAGVGKIPVERDFDTIRDSHSYDPETDRWSTVEKFEGVDILEDPAEQRADKYIYHQFWTYDAQARRWRKADIRDHGYQRIVPESSFHFWKNCALGLRAGAGVTFYENKLSQLRLTEVDGKFYLQTTEQQQYGQSYIVNWFKEAYGITAYPLQEVVGQVTYTQAAAGRFALAGRGWSFPCTVFAHYTLFERLRLGAGLSVEVHHLQVLKHTGDLNDYEIDPYYAWTWQANWFGLLGYKLLHQPHQNVTVDVQVGPNYSVGYDPRELYALLRKGKYLYDGWLVGAGLAYERKLNNYFSYLARLGGDWKTHDDSPAMLKGTDAGITLNQLTLHIDLGLQVSFGKDKAYEEAMAARAAAQAAAAAEAAEQAKKDAGKPKKKKSSRKKARRR